MSVECKNKKFYIRFKPFDKQFRIGIKGCSGKRQAQAVEFELVTAIREGRYSNMSELAKQTAIRLFTNQGWKLPDVILNDRKTPPEPVLSLWDAIRIFRSDPSFNEIKDVHRTEISLAHLVDFFKRGKSINEIKVPQLKEYRAYRQMIGIKNSTINRELSTLSKMFRILMEHELVSSNPCSQLKKLSEKDGQRQAYLGYSDVCKIADNCPDWFQDVIWIAYFSGMRRGEVYGLEWPRINLGDRMIFLHSSDTKEGHHKRVPVHSELLPVFNKLRKIRKSNDERLFDVRLDSLKKPWQRSIKKLAWPKPTPRFHDLRHTWKTNARRSGIDFEIREAILGHSNRKLDVSQRYGFIDDSELIRAIDKFTYDCGKTQILASLTS